MTATNLEEIRKMAADIIEQASAMYDNDPETATHMLEAAHIADHYAFCSEKHKTLIAEAVARVALGEDRVKVYSEQADKILALWPDASDQAVVLSELRAAVLGDVQ